MNTLEERLRAALEETAEEIAPHSVPPLRLRPPRRRRRLPGIAGRDPWATWLAPLAAAAAVAVVIIASVAVSGTIGGRRGTGPASLAGGLPRYYVALRFSAHNSCCTDSQPLVPKTHAVVVDSATGAVLATIAPPGPHDTFAGVSGAADDRTFVLGVQRYGTPSPTRFYLLRIGPGGAGVGLPAIMPTVSGSLLPATMPTVSGSLPPAISPTSARSPLQGILLAPVGSPHPSISPIRSSFPSPRGSAPPSASPSPRGSALPSASPTPRGPATPSASPSPRGSATPSASPSPRGRAGPNVLPGPPGGPFARLSPLLIPPDTAGMMNFALSPRGTSLAVFDDAGLHVTDLATGAQRTWNRPVACFGGRMLGSANTDAMLSWAADGQHLATACYTTEPRLTGVWLLDTSAPGGNLVSDSRLLVPGPPVALNGQPPWNRVLLTADGRTVVGVLEVPDPHRSAVLSPIQELAEYSAQTGKLLRVLNRMPVRNWVDFEQVLWASTDGHSLLVSDTVPYPGRRRAFFLLNDAGVLTGGHFTPLRGWSVDTMAAAF